jgi:hypothetical protein
MVFGAAKRGLGILGKKMTGSHKIKKGSWQDLDRPKNPHSKKADWEIKADRKDMARTDRRLTLAKNIGKIGVGAAGGATIYNKTKSKKKKDKK